VGPVKLSTVGTPQVSETTVKRAEASRLLEFSWGGNLRWELEPLGSGTRLTLWHNIDHRFIAWGAAGWHICFDVLDHGLAGQPTAGFAPVSPTITSSSGRSPRAPRSRTLQACSTPAFKATSDALSTFMRAMKSMGMPSRRSSVLRWP